MIYTAKANQLYNLGDDVKKMKAKILFVPAKSDLIFPPELSQRAAERYRAQGVPDAPATFEWCVFAADAGSGTTIAYEDAAMLIVDSQKMSAFLVGEAKRLISACEDEQRRFVLGDGLSPDW